MEMSQFHYLPLTPGFFSILVGIFGIVFLLLELGALRYAFLSLGVSARTAMWLLVVNGLVYVILGFATGRFRRKLLPIRPAEVVADVRSAYSGHTFCSADPWVYGLSILAFANAQSQAPFHPTPDGKRRYAALVTPVVRTVLGPS